MCLTNGDCCCITPGPVIQIEHLASVLSSVFCSHTWDLKGRNTTLEVHKVFT